VWALEDESEHQLSTETSYQTDGGDGDRDLAGGRTSVGPGEFKGAGLGAGTRS